MAQETEKIPQTAEEATTVGMFLKYTRLKQKKSVETVADALCIRKIYINALEEDDYQTLAPIPYGVGFIRSYAKYLGLNVDRVVQCYKQQAMPKKEKPVPTVVKKHPKKNMPNKRHIYIALGAIVLLYLLWVAVRFIASDSSKDVSQTQNLQSVESISFDSENISNFENSASAENIDTEQLNSQDLNEEQIVVVEDDYIEPEENEPKSRVVIKLKGDSWIELKDSEKTYLNAIYHKGFEYEVPDVKNLILSVGRYYNVDVYIDGKPVKVAGPKKQTKIKLDNFLKH